MPVPAPSQISICQEACAHARATLIQDIAENSNEAEKCRMFYPVIVGRLLEYPHDWSFANQRVQLAQAGTNPRPFDWGYAYNLPQNMAAPIRLLPDWTTLGFAVPTPTTGDIYLEATRFLQESELPYVIEGGLLYCNVQNAWLDFTINDIDGVAETNMFAAAVALELGAKLAYAVKGDANREKELLSMADLALQRAIAADRNRQPETYGDYVPESIAARHWDAYWPFRRFDCAG